MKINMKNALTLQSIRYEGIYSNTKIIKMKYVFYLDALI